MNNDTFPTSTLFHYPILLLLADGKEHTHNEFRDKVIAHLGISEEHQNEKLKDGKNKLSSWTHFAIRNLKDANLIMTKVKGSGKYIITDLGRKFLAINSNGFKGGTGKSLLSRCNAMGLCPESELERDVVCDDRPEESSIPEKSITVKLSDLAASANATLPGALLDAVKQMKPQSFEILIKKLLIAMGYGKTNDDVIVTNYVGDYGIDGYVRKDRLDIEKMCVYQAKRYTTNNVGIKEMNALGGSMINYGTTCGIFVTTTDYTPAAKKYDPRGFKIIRLDGKCLVGYLIEYGIGVKTETVEVKTVDVDFLNGL